MKEIIAGFTDGQTSFELTDRMYEQLVVQAEDDFAANYRLVDENRIVIIHTKYLEFIELIAQ